MKKSEAEIQSNRRSYLKKGALLRKIHTFHGESAFSTWLHSLAVNVLPMRLRRKCLSLVSIEATLDPDDETGSPREASMMVRLTCC